jgi:hypothetical protein
MKLNGMPQITTPQKSILYNRLSELEQWEKRFLRIMKKILSLQQTSKTVFDYGTENKIPAIGHQRF